MKPRSSIISSASFLIIFLTLVVSISRATATPSPSQGGLPFWPRSSNDNDDNSNTVTMIFGETKRGLVTGPARLDIKMTQRPDGRWQGQEPLGEGLYRINNAHIQSAPGKDIVCFLVWYRKFDPDLGYRPEDLAYQPVTVEQPVTGTIDRVSYVLCTPKFGGLR